MLFKTGQAAGIFLKHRAKKIGSKAKNVFGKAKGVAKKLKSKITPTPESVLGARAKMQTAIRKGSYKTSQFVNKAGKHVMKNKNKYTAGAIGVSGIGLYSAAKNDNLGKLKKSDQRYKELKRKGFI
jgi:hypothetical protein